MGVTAQFSHGQLAAEKIFYSLKYFINKKSSEKCLLQIKRSAGAPTVVSSVVATRPTAPTTASTTIASTAASTTTSVVELSNYQTSRLPGEWEEPASQGPPQLSGQVLTVFSERAIRRLTGVRRWTRSSWRRPTGSSVARGGET